MNNKLNNNVNVEEQTQGGNKMNNKMEQKAINIVDGANFFTVYQNIFNDGEITYTLKPEDDTSKLNELFLAVISNNPKSRFFSVNSTSESMLDEHLNKELVKYAIKDSDNGKATLSYVNKEIKVDAQSLTVKTNGSSVQELLVVSADKLGIVENLIFNSDSSSAVRGTMEEVFGEFSVWKPEARTVSNARSGDLEFMSFNKSYLTRIEDELKFNLSAYAKEFNNSLEVKVNISSRLKLAGSSGKPFDIFKGLKFISVEEVSFKSFEGDVIGDHYVFEDENGKVYNHLVLPEDFQVKLEEEIVTPSFSDKTELVSSKEVFIKEATDGSIYIDMEYLESKGLNKDLQVRITPVIKGMLNNVKGLNKVLGYDVIYFGGSVKGNPAPFFKEGNMDFYILGEARDEREPEDNYLMISNQLARELERRNNKILDVLEENTKDLVKSAYNQDKDALDKFVGLDKEDSDELDSENLTAEMYASNPDSFNISDSFKKRLSDFLNKSMQDVNNAARYYVEDSSFRHMVSDVYEVVRHMSKGRMAYDAIKGNDKQGIAPGYVVASRKVNGKYDVDYRKAILGRFPMLHQLEIQVVNETPNIFLTKAMENFYRGQIMQGKHQGVIYYSLYDMTAEAQSGADFDGDTTVVIFDEEITSLIDAKAKFLDFSYLNGELVDGVPWKEDLSTPITDIISKDKVNFLEANGVSYEEGVFTLGKDSIKNDVVREYIYETIIKLDVMNNGKNNIGQFTNINSSVLEMITVLEEKRSQVLAKGEVALADLITAEIKGYKKLNFFIAAAIRWEIDKAKHGGQFYEELKFLEVLLESKDNQDLNTLTALEEEYDIKLVRLFKNYNNSNDVINKGLSKLGIARVNLVRNEDDDSGLNMSSSIYRGKGQGKGTKFNSRYDKYIDEMNRISDENTKDLRINEMKNGFYREADFYIQTMSEKGISLNVTPSKNALDKINKLDTKFVPNNAGELIEHYKRQAVDMQTKISEKLDVLKGLYQQQVGGEVLNIDKLSSEVLIDKLNLDADESAEIYELEAQKDMMMEEFKALGEKFTPEDKFESALLFAELYAMNVRNNVSKRNNKLNDESHVNHAKYLAKKHLQELFVKKHGMRKATQEELVNINNWIERNYSDFIQNDNGLSSITTLFPLSTIQFLELMGNKEITTLTSKGQNVVAFMNLEQGQHLPDNVKEALKSIEGTRIRIEQGTWGELSVDVEDLAGKNKDVNISNKDFDSLNNKARMNKLSEVKFNRGAHLWTGNKEATIALAVVYNSGVKLFLEDVKEVQ